MKASIATALLVAACAASPAAAQIQVLQTPMACADREYIMSIASGEHGQSQRAIGLAANGAAMEVFVNDENGTWMIALTPEIGALCVIADGKHFRMVDPKPAGEPS